MPQHSKEDVIAGRNAVDAYRGVHAELYSKPWHRGIPEEHTPLLNELLAKLRKQEFTSLDEFFAASDELNITELGFKDRADFEAKATEADRQAFMEMWQ
jgi:hypothetical protein